MVLFHILWTLERHISQSCIGHPGSYLLLVSNSDLLRTFVMFHQTGASGFDYSLKEIATLLNKFQYSLTFYSTCLTGFISNYRVPFVFILFLFSLIGLSGIFCLCSCDTELCQWYFGVGASACMVLLSFLDCHGKIKMFSGWHVKLGWSVWIISGQLINLLCSPSRMVTVEISF